MGKFQLNKKGEDPIKIYEDTFKIANDTVETHLGKLGKMPNPISRESKATEVWIDIFYYIQSKPQGVTYEELKEKFGGRSDFEYFLFDHIMDGASRRMAYWDGKLIKAHESKASEGQFDQEIQNTIDNIAKKQAEYTRECPDGCGKKFNTIDDNAVAYHLYNDHGYSSEDSRKSAGLEAIASEYDDEYEYDDDGTKLNPLYDDDDEYIDGSDVPTSGTYESKASEDATGSKVNFNNMISQTPYDEQQGRLRNARDEESPLDNIYSSDAVADRIARGNHFTHAQDMTDDWSGNPIHESKANELTDIEKAKKKLRNQGNSMGMDDINYGLQEPYRDLDEESWKSVEAIASEYDE